MIDCERGEDDEWRMDHGDDPWFSLDESFDGAFLDESLSRDRR